MTFAALEPGLRIGAFASVFVILAFWEVLAPSRASGTSRRARWPGNLMLLAVNVAVIRVLVPGAAIAVAVAGEVREWGFLNALHVPRWFAVLAGIMLLDLVLYFQHVMFHAVPTLWRLHRVHHSDLDVDVTTGTRFHPIEILLSTAIKCAAVAAIGAPAIAVLAFEVLLNATSMFNHANVRLPAALDHALRLLLVTPAMHRVHHSIEYDESSSNFGFSLPWWDRLFGTYRASPRAGSEGLVFGVDAFRTVDDLRLDRLLVQPFQDTPGRYPINRRQATG
jgi:sterol desaturase/sphingolipid hydroxylase (fatty acid hydroxylase superfamily)